MAEWIETYRGVVSAWECDIVEHFTIAYYFDRFADATRNLIELIGESESLGAAAGAPGSRLVATFQHELRAGAAHHILSAVTGVEATALQLRHQVIDTTSGKVVTWVAETLPLAANVPCATRQTLAARVMPWTGPEIPKPNNVKSTGALTARDRVKPWEIDERGRLSLPDFVHRFSGAGMHLLTSIGLTSDYMHKNRRGFSTFLLDFEIAGAAKAGDRIDVVTTVAHLGNTSLKYVHHMTGADGRAIASMVQAGVQLDLDARRPAPMLPEIRAAIEARLRT